MAPVRAQLVERQEYLLDLLRRRRSNGHSSSEEEIAAVTVENQVSRLTTQLQQAVAEITNAGILVRDIGRGLVDFPSRRDGDTGVGHTLDTPVVGWQRGEPAIEW